MTESVTGGDRLFRDLGPVDLFQMGADLTMSETLRGKGQHHLVNAAQAALTFRDDHRSKRGGPVPGHINLDRTDISDYRLGPQPVATVA